MRIKNLCNKANNLVKAGCVFFLSAIEPLAVAATGTGVTVSNLDNQTIDSLVGKVIEQVLTLARYVGVILLVFGIYQLYMSFKDENPDGKVKAITLLITSVGLMTIKSIMKAIGVIS